MADPPDDPRGEHPAAPEPTASPVLSYARPGADELTAVARFPDGIEASLAVAKLDAEGIVAHLDGMQADAYFGTTRRNHGFAGPRLLVRRDDLAAAREILANTPARRCLIDPIGSDAPAEPTCPDCKSTKVRTFRHGTWIFVGCTLLVALAVVLWQSGELALVLAVAWFVAMRLIPVYRCTACGKRFNDVDPDRADDDEDDGGDEDDADDPKRRPVSRSAVSADLISATRRLTERRNERTHRDG